jgi:hypothetical protein
MKDDTDDEQEDVEMKSIAAPAALGEFSSNR